MSDYGIKTYADLAETCRGMVLANEIASRPLEPVSGDWAPWDEIFQWYIVQDPSFLMEHTDEPVFYDAGLRARAGNPLTHRKGSSIALLPYLFRLLVLLVRIGPVLHAAAGTPCRLVLAFLQAHAFRLLLALVLVGKGLLG